MNLYDRSEVSKKISADLKLNPWKTRQGFLGYSLLDCDVLQNRTLASFFLQTSNHPTLDLEDLFS